MMNATKFLVACTRLCKPLCRSRAPTHGIDRAGTRRRTGTRVSRANQYPRHVSNGSLRGIKLSILYTIQLEVNCKIQ